MNFVTTRGGRPGELFMERIIIPNKIPNILAKRVVLFVNARDESHIQEWAIHHILIGFDAVIIFDHKSSHPLKRVFSQIKESRIQVVDVSHLENPIKIPLMNEAVKIARQMNADWFIYLDADEFLVLHPKFRGIKHLLNVYNYADSLAINWLMFGSSNLVRDPVPLPEEGGGVLANYTKSELLLTDHVKTFVRPNKVINATNPHYYHMLHGNRCFGTNHLPLKSDDKSRHSFSIEYWKAPAYIAHYVYQSEESFRKRKIALPRDDTGGYRHKANIDTKFIHDLYNQVVNTQLKERYVERNRSFLLEKMK